MISIVIPVYGSGLALWALIRRIDAAMNSCVGTYEVIFVEDGGGSTSWDIIKNIALEFPQVRGFQLSRNFGQHNAILYGIRAAKGRLIATMDDDLQHPPEAIPLLVEKLNEGWDVVYAPPIYRKHGILRNIASAITKIVLQNLIGSDNALHVSAFRVFHTELRDAFEAYQGPVVNIDVLLAWGGGKFSYLPIFHEERYAGKSGYTVRKLMIHALNMITGFSTLPLQLASILGFGFAFLGMIILGYVVYSWIMHGSAVPGFAFLASLISIFSGVQLLALGILGEYLSRIYSRAMNKPSYFLRSKIEAK